MYGAGRYAGLERPDLERSYLAFPTCFWSAAGRVRWVSLGFVVLRGAVAFRGAGAVVGARFLGLGSLGSGTLGWLSFFLGSWGFV